MDSNLSPKTYVIPAAASAGSEQPFDLTGSFFIVTDSTAAISIKAELIDDKGNDIGSIEYTPMQAGQGFQLASGERFKRIWFKNLTAAPNTVVLFYGTGRFIDARKAISIDTATITALAAAINSPVTLKSLIETRTNAQGAKVYSNLKSYEVIASGGTCRIQSASGSDYTLADGEGQEQSIETDTNFIEAITVTPNAGCTAKVSVLYV